MSYMTNNRERKRRMKTSLDNLILYVENVTDYQFNKFQQQLEIAETYGRIPRVKYFVGVRITQYHHNLTIGEGGGAVYIGYKHNTAKEHSYDGYRLRMEVNPSKHGGKGVEKAKQWFNELFVQSFLNNTKKIKGIDVAYDIPIAKNNLYVVSKTGREKQILKGTVFYGERSQHGHLKIYDKKKELKERQGIEIPEEHLTRVEFSVRIEEPMTIQFFGSIGHMGINDMYQVSELKIDNSEGLVKACLIAVSTGEMQMNELTRTYQNKTKKALASMGLLDLDHEYTNAQKEIINIIKQYLAPSKDTILVTI